MDKPQRSLADSWILPLLQTQARNISAVCVMVVMVKVRRALQIQGQTIKLDVASIFTACSVSGREDKEQGADEDMNVSVRKDHL